MLDAPKLRVTAVDLFERPVPFRIPFKFGATLVTQTPQAFVRASVELDDGQQGSGWSAELMVPKWFDKRPELSNEQNVDQLRRALGDAAHAYSDLPQNTAFGLSVAALPELLRKGVGRDDPALVTGFGAALLDRAILDAAFRLLGVSAFDGLARNLPAFDPEPWDSEMVGFDTADFLKSRVPATSVRVRHTIGMTDPLTLADLADGAFPEDGLPVTLEQVIARFGVDHFKIKVRGDIDADLERLAAIASILDAHDRPYRVTLDGNEQFADPGAVRELMSAINRTAALRRFDDSILYVEQPLHRDVTLRHRMSGLPGGHPIIIDEADGPLDAFPRARELGYRGVSSKACKGIYRSLLNACRIAASGPPMVHAAEDLTCQRGLAVQQDLAIVAFLGLQHSERNGHHFGSATAGAPLTEMADFLDAHPGLYRAEEGRVTLRIEEGRLDLTSLNCPGFGARPRPEIGTLEAMRVPDDLPAVGEEAGREPDQRVRNEQP